MRIAPAAIKRPALLVLVGGAFATLCSFLGRFNWILDLFAHFHLQYAVALIVAAICFAAITQRTLLIISLVVLVPNLISLSYYLPVRRSAPAAARSSGPLKIISFNVLSSNRRHADVLRHLEESDADLILLLEVSTEWLDGLRPLETSHPHFRQLPRSDNFGMALYSRLPIQSHELISLPHGLPYMVTQVEWHGAPLTIIGAHPLPPVGGRAARLRDSYLEELGSLTAELAADSPVILLGDLNTTPWSHCFRSLVRNSGLVDSGKHGGFLASWKRFNPVFSLPLDHILNSPELQAVDRWVGPDLGSDHRPVGATFQYR